MIIDVVMNYLSDDQYRFRAERVNLEVRRVLYQKVLSVPLDRGQRFAIEFHLETRLVLFERSTRLDFFRKYRWFGRFLKRQKTKMHAVRIFQNISVKFIIIIMALSTYDFSLDHSVLILTGVFHFGRLRSSNLSVYFFVTLYLKRKKELVFFE